MGSFGGHALPGSFFIFFGVWWTFNIFIRYYSSLHHGRRFTSTATYPCTCLCGRAKNWPIEPCLIIFFTTVGLSLEIYTGMSHGVFNTPGNAQHATMFFSFGLFGVISLLLHFKVSIPKDLDYVMAAMAFMIEWLLFRFHLHGRTPLDVLLHTLLLYTIGANVISVLVEMKYRHHVLAPLCRTFFVFMQGTWFWNVGFILYNPNPDAEKWKPDDHGQMMYATMFFIWHALVIFMIMLLVNGIVKCVYHKMCYSTYDKVELSDLKISDGNGYSVVNVEDSDDSDFETRTNSKTFD